METTLPPTLPAEAQALVQALQSAAADSVATRGFGYAVIHEDRVGGLGDPAPQPLDFAADDQGALEYHAAVEAYRPTEARIGLELLVVAGYPARASAGGSDRFIQLDAGRLTAKS